MIVRFKMNPGAGCQNATKNYRGFLEEEQAMDFILVQHV